MRFLFLILSIFCNYELRAAAPRELGEVSPYSRLPVMLRADAVAFHGAIDPLLSKDAAGYERRTLKNPYELFMEATLLGSAFGIMPSDRSEQGLGSSITSLVTAREAQSIRQYFLVLNDVAVDVVGNEINRAQLLRCHSAFNSKFNDKLTELIGAKNIYAYFVKGLMLYEQGVLENQQSLKTQAELYLACAADAYCEPALRFLKWLYATKKQSKLGSIAGNKLKHVRRAGMLSSSIKEVIEFAIENEIFGESIAAKVLASNTKQNQVVDSTFVDPLTKLAETAFGSAGFDKAFYEGVFKRLNKTTNAMRRTAPTGILWKLSTMGAPLVVMSISAYQIWYAAATNVPLPYNGTVVDTATNMSLVNASANTTLIYPSANDIASAEVLVMLNFTAPATLLTSLTSFVYNVRTWYNAPQLVSMDDAMLDMEHGLSALYLAAVRQPTDIDEVVAEKVIKFWCADGRCLFGKKPSLSQLVVKHKGG